MTILAVPTKGEAIFTYGAPHLKFGPGASNEIGFGLAWCGVRCVPVVADPGVIATNAPRADDGADGRGRHRGAGVRRRLRGGERRRPAGELAGARRRPGLPMLRRRSRMPSSSHARHREIANEVRAVGYTRADSADLVGDAMKHRWPLVIWPMQVTEEDVAQIFERPRELR